MSGLSSIIYLLLSACQFIILLRFLSQASNVNYYNPVTKSIVKISGYLVSPFEAIEEIILSKSLFFSIICEVPCIRSFVKIVASLLL